jgi:hypothetical protein
MADPQDDELAISGFSVPILLLVWRRPVETRRLLAVLRRIRPRRLYVACDGPASDEDEAKVALVRRIVETEIDWDCQVSTRFMDENLGCRKGVASAVSWFFDHVLEGIVLEDDLAPELDFFRFAQALLEQHRDDERVWAICGHNPTDVMAPDRETHFYTRYFHPWGWASWSRAWKQYDAEMALWRETRNSRRVHQLFPSFDEEYTWRYVFEMMSSEDAPDTWDMQWLETILLSEGYVALPSRNLVANHGNGPDATHMTEATGSVRPSFPLDGSWEVPPFSYDSSLNHDYFVAAFGWERKRGTSGRIARMHRLLPRWLRRVLRSTVGIRRSKA